MIELLIAKSAFGGDGIALHDGKVYFVEGALPGEKVSALVTEEKKNFCRAKILKILEASGARVVAPCPYVTHCGGCQYQHADYREELRLKQSQIAEILQSVPGASRAILKPIVPSDREYGYRNSVTLHSIFSKKKRSSSLGFVGKDNVTLIPVKSCHLIDQQLAVILQNDTQLKNKAKKVTFKLSEKGQIVSDLEESFFRVRIGGEPFLTSSRGFFQNNLYVAGRLAGLVSDWVKSVRPDAFFDLYAGVGTFAMLAARDLAKIVAIEESPDSVQAMRMNREEKKLAALRIVEGRVEKIFPGIFEEEKAQRPMILMDPPRQGITQGFAEFLAGLQDASALVYVSCDPATLARDLKIILSRDRWRIQEVVPFDMFPRTKHIETAVLLTGIREQVTGDRKEVFS